MKLNNCPDFYINLPTLASSFGGIVDEKSIFQIKKKSAGNFACGAIDRFISKLEKEEQGSHMNLETAHPGGMLWCHRWRKNIS